MQFVAMLGRRIKSKNAFGRWKEAFWRDAGSSRGRHACTGNLHVLFTSNYYQHGERTQMILASRRSLSFASSFSFGQGSESSENLVERTERNLGSQLESSGTASTADFLAVLRTLADSKLPDAPLKAERWLRRLEQLEGVTPTSECYQRAIEAWASAASEDPARVIIRCESWIQKAQKIPDESLRANTACFNAFLDACTRGRSFKGSRGGGKLVVYHAEVAERALRYMILERQKNGPGYRISPNTESFNLVIRGWTRCRKMLEIADKATNVLHLMEQYCTEIDSGVEPNSRTYGLIMDAVAVKAKLKAKRCLMKKCNPLDPASNGLEEINLIRSLIEAIYNKNHAFDVDDGSNTYNYNVLLGCWANISSLHEIATTEAENILQHMVALKESGQAKSGPDATSYLITMRVWCNSTKANKGERITWLLNKQWRDFEFTNDEALRPGTAAYNMCLRVWCMLENPAEAEKILSEMTRLSEDIYGESLRPDSNSFGYVIKAWLQVADKGSIPALNKAAHWLDKLRKYEEKETGMLSSSELYLSFLGSARCCSRVEPDVLSLCFEVFGYLEKSRHAITSMHYSRLLQVALAVLAKPEDDEVRYVVVGKIINDCKNAGLVSGKVLKALSNGPVRRDDGGGWTVAASRDAVNEHFPSWPLPAAWTQNLGIADADIQPEMMDLQRQNMTAKFYQFKAERKPPVVPPVTVSHHTRGERRFSK